MRKLCVDLLFCPIFRPSDRCHYFGQVCTLINKSRPSPIMSECASTHDACSFSIKTPICMIVVGRFVFHPRNTKLSIPYNKNAVFHICFRWTSLLGLSHRNTKRSAHHTKKCCFPYLFTMALAAHSRSRIYTHVDPSQQTCCFPPLFSMVWAAPSPFTEAQNCRPLTTNYNAFFPYLISILFTPASRQTYRQAENKELLLTATLN